MSPRPRLILELGARQAAKEDTLRSVNLTRLQLEGYCFVWLSSDLRESKRGISNALASYESGKGTHHQILPRSILHLDVLLKAAHESVQWLDSLLDLGQVDLKQHSHSAAYFAILIFQERLSNLGDLVPGSSNLDEALLFHIHDTAACCQESLCIYISRRLLGFSGRSSTEICLVLFPLSVRQVGAFIGMQR